MSIFFVYAAVLAAFGVLFFRVRGFFGKSAAFVNRKVFSSLGLPDRIVRTALMALFISNILAAAASFLYYERDTVLRGFIRRDGYGGISFTENLVARLGEEEEQIKTLLDGFMQRYIDCLSNASRNVQGNYNALKPYIVSGSDIDRRVRDNMESQAWAHSGGDTVTKRDDLLLMNMGNGYYLAELDYTLDTIGNKGHVESVNRVIVLMSRTDSGLKAIEIYSL